VADAILRNLDSGSRILVSRKLREHPLDPLELCQHLPGIGPVILVGRHAPERQLRHGLHARHHARVLFEHRGVDDLPELADLDLGHHPVRQRHVPPLPAHVQGPQPRDELQDHHAEAVHVTLLGELEGAVVVRVQVPRRPLRRGAAHELAGDAGGARVRRREEAREAEVAEAGAHVGLHEDVRRGDVAVHDGGLDAEVEVLKRRRDLGRHGEAGPPGDRRGRARGPAVEVVREGAVGDEVVDEEEGAGVGAESVEADEVRVAERGEDEHLVAEGPGCRGRRGGEGRERRGRHVEAFDRGGAPARREVREEHRPEPAVPELAGRVESGGGGVELLVGEAGAVVVEPVAAKERRGAGPRVPHRRAAAPAEAADGDGRAEAEQEHREKRRGGDEHGACVPGALGVVRRRGHVVGAVLARGRRREAGGGEEEEEGELQPHLDAAIQARTERDARTKGAWPDEERMKDAKTLHCTLVFTFHMAGAQGIATGFNKY
jgi:hypothetical protein